MLRFGPACSAAALAASLAACAMPAPPPAPIANTVPTPVADAATGGMDGVYRAPLGGAIGNSKCGKTRFSNPIRVKNGMAILQTVRQGRLEGNVAPDGSLVILHGDASLRGQFTGDKFNGTYAIKSCALTLNYSK